MGQGSENGEKVRSKNLRKTFFLKANTIVLINRRSRYAIIEAFVVALGIKKSEFVIFL